MDLNLQEVADLFQVSKSVIEKWLSEGKIPSYQLKGEHLFSRDEIEAWLVRSFNQEGLSVDIQEPFKGIQQFNLYRALNKGFVLQEVYGHDKNDLIRNSISQISEKLDIDAEVLSSLLIERENLMSTALNKGVAVPHTREFLLSEAYDSVTIVFPKSPIEFGALDHKPVHSLFFLFACQDKRHLNLLAKIAYFCGQEENLAFLQTQPEKKVLLNYVMQWEAKLPQLQMA